MDESPQNSYRFRPDEGEGAGDLFRKGRKLFKIKRFREAVALLEKATELEPGNKFIRTALADSFRRMKKYNEAIRSYEEVLDLDAEDVFALVGMGECLRGIKDLPRAEDCYRRVLIKEPNNLYALRGMGDVCRGLKRLDLALEYWQRYIDRRPDDVFVLTRVGDALKSLGRLKQAESTYHKALEINTGDHYAKMGLADLYQKTGQDQLAIDFYEQVLEKRPNLVNILTIVGNLLWNKDEHEKARTCFEKVYGLDSRNSYGLYGLGRYYRWRRNYPKAIEFWERILETEPGTVSMLTRLGDAYRNIGKLDYAERTYRKSLERGYDRFGMLGLAKLFAIKGDIPNVVICYEELLTNEGEDGGLFRSIISQANECQQAEIASELYSTVKVIFPDREAFLQSLKQQMKGIRRPHAMS